jgi:hypothetical protein
LKKETEYAKKLIMNENKLDHLIDVLDRSREHIIRQSIDVYDDNNSQMFSNVPHLMTIQGDSYTQRT